MIHTVKGFGVVNETDALLEFPYFFYDPAVVGNLISGSSGFSKSSLYLWKFSNRWEDQTTWPASWKICVQVRKQQLELDMEQQTGSK